MPAKTRKNKKVHNKTAKKEYHLYIYRLIKDHGQLLIVIKMMKKPETY